MPKYGIHAFVLAESSKKLIASESESEIASILRDHRSLAALGSVGPDMFFWAPDFSVARKLYMVYSNIKAIVDLYNSVVEPVKAVTEVVGEAGEKLVETLADDTVSIIKTNVEELKETTGLLKSALLTGVFVGVLEGVDIASSLVEGTIRIPSLSAMLFDNFRPPLQNNSPEQHWYWFDMLHYRNTGEFAQALVKNAETEAQKAYAYGYLSHIATDLVGHAFVNQIVGGPYRLHPQRHVTVENYLDSWMFRKWFEAPAAMRLDDALFLKGSNGSLDTEVRDLLDKAFRETYQSVPHPERLDGGYLTREDISKTYEVFYETIHLLMTMHVNIPKEPFSDVVAILGKAWKDVLKPPPVLHVKRASCGWDSILSLGITSKSRECYANFFKELPHAFAYAGKLLAWTIERAVELCDAILTSLTSLPTTVLLAGLYGVQLLLYELYQHFHHLLALAGLVYPDINKLDDAHGRNLTTTFQCEIRPQSGATDDQPWMYPRWYDLYSSHLVCPPNKWEWQLTNANFEEPSENATAFKFISDAKFDEETLGEYALAESVQSTLDLQEGGRTIGNAIDLTTWMIKSAANNENESIVYTNWNLDADRGYGYKCWSGKIPGQGYTSIKTVDQTVSERYLD